MRPKATDCRKGMTLAETLIACSLLLVFMGACYSLFQQALRTFHFGDERASTLSRLRTTLDFLSREIRDSDQLYSPKSSDITAGTSLRSESIIIRVSSDVYEYIYDQQLSTVTQIYFEPGYDPDQQATQREAGRRVIGRDFSYLLFTWEKPPDPWTTPIPQFVKISLGVKEDPNFPGSGMALSTKVMMRK